MPNDYYNDGGGDAAVPGSGQDEPQEQRDPRDEKTALIPSALCPDLQPGDEIKLKIVAVHENEYEVAYASDKEDETSAESEPSTAGASQDNNLMSMMD